MNKNKEETKKEKIKKLAQRKPFMSCREIAKKIKTTEKYVRTALDECGISLLLERKKKFNEIRQENRKLRARLNRIKKVAN